MTYTYNVFTHWLQPRSPSTETGYGIHYRYRLCMITSPHPTTSGPLGGKTSYHWNLEPGIWVFCIALKCDRLLGSTTTETTVSSQSHRTTQPGPIFTKRTDVLPLDIAKPRIRLNFSNFVKFDRHLGSSAVETLVKFQGDTIIVTPNLAASRPIYEIWW